MENNKELERLIRTSYGREDNKFAMHYIEMDNAAKAIVEANKQHVGFKKYLELHREHLKSKCLGEELIETQLKKVQDIRSYFSND